MIEDHDPDEFEDGPYCECGLEHTMEELDFNICAACGGVIEP
jgi:hypothetical protein